MPAAPSRKRGREIERSRGPPPLVDRTRRHASARRLGAQPTRQRRALRAHLLARVDPLEQRREARHAELLEIIAQPGFYEQPPDEVANTLNAVTESEQALDRALERRAAHDANLSEVQVHMRRP